MTPEDVAERLAAWAERGGTRRGDDGRVYVTPRRVEYVEPEGPRRTWTLYEDGRQVGMVQGRAWSDVDVDARRIDEGWVWRWLGVAEELAP